MRNKRVFILLMCVFLAAVVLVPGCGNPAQAPVVNDAAQQQAREHVLKGISYFAQKQWDESIAEYTRAIEIDPNLAAAYSNRGSAYGEKGDYDKAIAEYSTAIKLAPGLADTYRNRGIAYGKKGDYDKAIADLDTVIALDPRDALAYYNRGAAYDKKGDKIKAEADFAKAKELGLK